MSCDYRANQTASEYGDVRPEEQRTMLDFSGESLRQAQQAEEDDAARPGGAYEPRDSRNVTGASGGGIGAPGGAHQQTGGKRWGGDGQQTQAEGSQQTGQSSGSFGAQQAQAENNPATRTGGSPMDMAQQGQPQAQQSGQGQQQGQRQQQGQVQADQVRFDAQGAGRGSENAFEDQGAGGHQRQASASESDPSRQQTQFEANGDLGQGSGQQWAGQIREHMQVIGADGAPVGTVDKVEGDRIKLTKADSGMGSHQGHHHFISCGLVSGVEGDTVRLSATGANAYAMEQER